MSVFDDEDEFLDHFFARRPSPAPMGSQCTFARTGSDFYQQPAYHCLSCNFRPNDTMCAYCAKVCHRGHMIVSRGELNCFCDCGDPSNERVNQCHRGAAPTGRTFFKQTRVYSTGPREAPKSTTSPREPPKSTTKSSYINLPEPSTFLYLHQDANTARILGKMPSGLTVKVVSQVDGWNKLQIDDMVGWAQSRYQGVETTLPFKGSRILVHFTALWNGELFFIELSSFGFSAWSPDGKKSSVSSKFKWSDEGRTLVFEGEKMKILKEWLLPGVEERYNVEKSTFLEEGRRCASCQEMLKRAGTVVVNLENGGVYCSNHVQFERLARLYESDARRLHEEFAKEEKRKMELERERREKEERERMVRKMERVERLAKERERLENEKMERETIENIRRMALAADKEKMEIGRKESERLEQERREREKQKESERIKREEKERAEKERERVEKERAEKERAEKTKAEKEKREEMERKERERKEMERMERERIAMENAENSTHAESTHAERIVIEEVKVKVSEEKVSPDTARTETARTVAVDDWTCDDVINWFKTLKLSKDFSEVVKKEALDGSGLVLVVEEKLFKDYDIIAKTDILKITKGLEKIRTLAQ